MGNFDLRNEMTGENTKKTGFSRKVVFRSSKVIFLLTVQPNFKQVREKCLTGPRILCGGGSYSELFTQKAVDVFVSHWWGHEFSEFVKALEHAAS